MIVLVRRGELFSLSLAPSRALEPLGCVGDLGWCHPNKLILPCPVSLLLSRFHFLCRYNIRFTLWAFDWQQPSRVTAVCHAMHDGAPFAAVCIRAHIVQRTFLTAVCRCPTGCHVHNVSSYFPLVASFLFSCHVTYFACFGATVAEHLHTAALCTCSGSGRRFWAQTER